jgi:2-dehydro-3-deoxyphosphogluconate aldolase/(4S)-4-hydroxy-2-oxoglutarate aldolase
LEQVTGLGVVAVLRLSSEKKALEAALAAAAGGIGALEVTFTVPGASRVLEELAGRADEEGWVVGAGTVLDGETARIGLLSGADFVVSPTFVPGVVETAHRYGALPVPGAATPTEVQRCLEAGARLVKIFPGDVLGPGFVRSVSAIFPGLACIPTGGVSLGNAADWIRAGCAAIGVGGELTGPAERGDLDEVTRRAAAFVQAVHEARRKSVE